MIKSITFDLHGDCNYLLNMNTKHVLKKGKTKKGYEKALEDYKNTSRIHAQKYFSKYEIFNDFYKTVDDGYENEYALGNLKDRTISFTSDKINLIFGANASGKTTILKTIAAHTLCGSNRQLDGFTNPAMFEPTDLHNLYDNEAYVEVSKGKFEIGHMQDYNDWMTRLNNKIDMCAGNGATIDWDGTLVYYENFHNRRNTGNIDDLCGSIMGELGDAISYQTQKNFISTGQTYMWLVDKIISTIKSCQSQTMEDVLNNAEKKLSIYNSLWYNSGKIQIDYLRNIYSKHVQNTPEIPTFMFDELDKSLDILNVIFLYKELLPSIQKKYNVQIILISHNPLVLSSLLDKDVYNIINMDEKYSNEVKSKLNNVTY
ncbi:MAG: ATP-binding protein [Lachnospiraceae bacterium]|nr:ATP-binding protein [Lachnospiraceae bacterium]MCM1236678.1 ATP-binding protein [Ruminococcus flavefaciens]